MNIKLPLFDGMDLKNPKQSKESPVGLSNRLPQGCLYAPTAFHFVSERQGKRALAFEGGLFGL